jgi:hypothetical protein
MEDKNPLQDEIGVDYFLLWKNASHVTNHFVHPSVESLLIIGKHILMMKS